jgi:hypothetical protein
LGVGLGYGVEVGTSVIVLVGLGVIVGVNVEVGVAVLVAVGRRVGIAVGLGGTGVSHDGSPGRPQVGPGVSVQAAPVSGFTHPAL